MIRRTKDPRHWTKQQMKIRIWVEEMSTGGDKHTPYSKYEGYDMEMMGYGHYPMYAMTVWPDYGAPRSYRVISPGMEISGY